MDHTIMMAHGWCYIWRADLIALHAISDVSIAFAYLLIPGLIWASLRTFKPVIYIHEITHIGWYFGAFILMCSLTHIASVVTIWTPAYYLQGWIKALTAVVSLVAAIQFWRICGRIARATEAVFAKEEHKTLIRDVLAAMQRHGVTEV